MPSCAADLPLDLLEYQRQFKMSEHFLGEPLYDAERREFIHIQIEKCCTPLDTKRSKLNQQYRNHPRQLELLKLPK